MQEKKLVTNSPEKKISKRQARRLNRKGKSSTAFKTISEVASILKIEQHVLRFWETKFKQVKPMKRGGGRRYYRPHDIELLTEIHKLLYTNGYTIKGVQKLLTDTKGKLNLGEQKIKEDVTPTEETVTDLNIRQNSVLNVTKKYRSELKNILGELKEIRSLVNY